MMAALIAGERDPKVLAQLARASMHVKISQLEEAFVGRFSGHHAFLLTKMLARIDAIDADIAEVETRIEEQIAPFADAVARLDPIPGVGVTTAQVIIAEVGLDMTRFPTAAQLASWAEFSPTVQSAGKKKGQNATGHGNSYLARAVGEAAISAGKTDTFLGERYRRIARRRGKQKAIVAVGRSILVIVWHLPTPRPTSSTSAPTSTTSAAALNGPSATTSATLRHSATRSPCNPPPEPRPRPFPAPLRSAGSCRLPCHEPLIFELVTRELVRGPSRFRAGSLGPSAA
jgi:transposase